MSKRNYTHVEILLPETKEMLAAGIISRPKGRPQKGAVARDIVAEQAYKINR